MCVLIITFVKSIVFLRHSQPEFEFLYHGSQTKQASGKNVSTCLAIN